MFRFTAPDNAAAAGLFRRAIEADQGFARAHAGLSFTCFQDAFLRYSDVDAASSEARNIAERAVALDPLDPFANATMGRACWLVGDLDAALPWLERAVALSPSYAQASYARAWTETLLGHGEEGQRHADLAMSLSPLDPMRYAMLATRALSHLVRDEVADAAHWAERAACDLGSHALIAVIAAACHAAHEEPARARIWVEAARARQPALQTAHFFQSFPFADAALRERISRHLTRSGMP